MGMHGPVILNDVNALGIGIGPTQGLIKQHQEGDGDCAGPPMKDRPGQRIQDPQHPDDRIGLRAAHGLGWLGRPYGGIGIRDGRLPFHRHFIQVDRHDPPRWCRRRWQGRPRRRQRNRTQSHASSAPVTCESRSAEGVAPQPQTTG